MKTIFRTINKDVIYGKALGPDIRYYAMPLNNRQTQWFKTLFEAEMAAKKLAEESHGRAFDYETLH